MQNYDIIEYGDKLYRILKIENNKLFVVDCRRKNSVPRWITLQDNIKINTGFLEQIELPNINTLDNKSRSVMYNRYQIISELLPHIYNFRERNECINVLIKKYKISKLTLLSYLWLFLVYQDKLILCPKKHIDENSITDSEKKMRQGLFLYYNEPIHSLKSAYLEMINSYYNENDVIPTYYQFRYFYRKNKKLNKINSQDGKNYYRRNSLSLELLSKKELYDILKYTYVTEDLLSQSLIILIINTGINIKDLCRLRISDIDIRKYEIHINGKTVPITNFVSDILERYIKSLNEKCKYLYEKNDKRFSEDDFIQLISKIGNQAINKKININILINSYYNEIILANIKNKKEILPKEYWKYI